MMMSSIQRARIEAIASVLLILTLPLAVAAQMTVGGALGVPTEDPDPPPEYWLRSVLWAASFFTPFVVGAVLGLDAARRRPVAVWRFLGWIGAVGNLAVIALAILFAVGEVANPH